MTSPTPPWQWLKFYINSQDADDNFIQYIWNDATEIVNAYVGTKTIPDPLLQHAYLVCGMNLYQARVAQNGIVGLLANDRPIFAPKDPMQGVYQILRGWVNGYL